MQINGVAHTFITVGDFAAARAFYGKLLPFLGMTIVAGHGEHILRRWRSNRLRHPCRQARVGQRFRQGAVGLHHHCWRARENGDVDEAYSFLKGIGATSSMAFGRTPLRRGTTRCSLRTPTVLDSKSTTCPARACSRRANALVVATLMERRTNIDLLRGIGFPGRGRGRRANGRRADRGSSLAAERRLLVLAELGPQRSKCGKLPRVSRRLAAILAADVVGYSCLMGRDESTTLGRQSRQTCRLLN
jgi:hypothetical protein